LRFLPLWGDGYEAWSGRGRAGREATFPEGAPPPALSIPLSTAAVLSARFPWVTPAGWFHDYLPEAAPPKPAPPGVEAKERLTARRQKVRLVDGGYFENSGAATAQDLIKAIEASPIADKVDVKLIVLTTGTFSEQASFALGEAIDPVLALLNVRSARTHITIAAARNDLDARDQRSQVQPRRLRTVTLRSIGYSLPLGWRLSRFTQKLIELQHGNPDRCTTLGTGYLDKPGPGSWAPGVYEADCLVGLIADELSGGSPAWSGSKAEIERAKADLDRAASDCYKDDPAQVSIGACSLVIDRLPRVIAAYNYRGAAHAHGGDTAKAIADFTRAIELYPIDGEAYHRRGAVHERMGQLDLALADYTAAIKNDPYRASSYIKRAALYIKQGQHEPAIADYTIAIGTWPRRSGTYLLRAEVYRRTGNLARAITDYSRLIELEPNNASYLLYRGLVRFTQADFKGALPDFQRSLEIDGGTHALLYRFLAQSRAGESTAAARDLETSADRLESKSWPHAALELFLGRSNPGTVLTAAAKPSETCEAQFYVGQWHLLRGSRQEAATTMRAATESCAISEFEHAAAVAELNRLEPSP
jgi:tetratricopeptide (TPR) repeat protein